MDVEITTLLTAMAIIVMIYCLWLVMTLKAKVPGGIVGRRWKLLTGMVGLFALGYIAVPFFGDLPEGTMRMVVASIFFFGALYVAITIKLIYTVIEELGT